MTNAATTAVCHCGKVSIRLKSRPTEITECNCSLCTAYGARWAYFDADEVEVADGVRTDTYAWNGRHIDFHRCADCGCITHWTPRGKDGGRRGINARLLPSDVCDAAKLRHKDGADTGEYLN